MKAWVYQDDKQVKKHGADHFAKLYRACENARMPEEDGSAKLRAGGLVASFNRHGLHDRLAYFGHARSKAG
jgi:hypothetical protein